MLTAQKQLVLPLDYEVLIPDDSSVRILSQIADELDYSSLYATYSKLGRKPANSPRILFKILTYGASQTITSSRKLEQSCRRDVNYMWLLEGEAVPDHNTLARFRSERLSLVIEDLFYQLINKLYELDEIQHDHLFIDGTKLEANANRYTFVWRKAVEKNEVKLHEKVDEFLSYFKELYDFEEVLQDEDYLELLRKMKGFVDCKKADLGIAFVHGKGSRKTPFQRDYETIESYLERQEKYSLAAKTFEGRNSYSKTDTDATFMHMKEDHMRNSQLKPGYNLQIGVENEYVIAADIYSERSDQLTLKPFLESIQENLGVRHTDIIADAGYESEENYTHLQDHNQTAYIKPSTYAQQNKRSFKKKIGRRENMTYLEAEDCYICHNNKRLNYSHDKKRTSKSGFKSAVKVYECEDCSGCEFKSQCTRAKNNRRLEVATNFIEKRKQSQSNITSPDGIIYRMNRSIQVEGAFGVIKEDYDFRRVTMRGKAKVKTEVLLVCFGYNINKLHSKTVNNRRKSGMFKVEKDTA